MPAFNTTKLSTIEQDVTYGKMDGQDLKMDIYYPPAGGPWPGLIFVHGGGWSEGDKAPLPPMPAEAGYLVVSINYRMYPAYRFPAMIKDVKCAVRSLRAHAADYNLDPERIALIGHSAGAHLAALAGLCDQSAGWDAGPFADESSQVQAVIEMSGPSDLTRHFPDDVSMLISNVFGAEQRVSASPVMYARQDAPPFMIIHGDADEIVPVEQAHLLHAALIQAGASSELLIVQHAGHGFEPAGGVVAPSMEEIFGTILAFLTKSLGRG